MSSSYYASSAENFSTPKRNSPGSRAQLNNGEISTKRYSPKPCSPNRSPGGQAQRVPFPTSPNISPIVVETKKVSPATPPHMESKLSPEVLKMVIDTQKKEFQKTAILDEIKSETFKIKKRIFDDKMSSKVNIIKNRDEAEKPQTAGVSETEKARRYQRKALLLSMKSQLDQLVRTFNELILLED